MENDQKASQKNQSLKSKLKKGVLATASALFFPTNLKRAAVYLATYFILQPLAGMMFPRAEDKLSELGLKPEIAQELAPGVHVHVRSGDRLLDRMHALFDRGGMSLPFFYDSHIRENNGVQGYARYQPSAVLSLLAPSFNLCNIYIKRHAAPKDTSLTLTIESDDETITARQQRTALSQRQLEKETLLHEMTHCGQKELSSIFAREADADHRAMEILAREEKNPALKQAVLDTRAMFTNIDADHDTALYLEAKIIGKPVPSETDMLAANKAAQKHYGALMLQHAAQDFSICNDSPENQRTCDITARLEELPPLARHRAELFLDAIKRNTTVTITPKPSAPPAGKKLREIQAKVAPGKKPGLA